MLFIVAVALAVVIQSCVRKDGVWYNFVNNSADEVEFLFPIKPMSYYPFICGDMFDIDIDDTTVTSARPLFARCTVFPYDESQQYQYLQPIITQYFIDNKSEIWLLFLIAHSKR